MRNPQDFSPRGFGQNAAPGENEFSSTLQAPELWRQKTLSEQPLYLV